jgi:hypothetical protein
VATVLARNAIAFMLPIVVSGGSLESGGRVCVGAFGRNLATVAVKIFYISLLHKGIYAAVNCITTILLLYSFAKRRTVPEINIQIPCM